MPIQRDIYQIFPYEIVYGLCESLKTIQIIFIAKWIHGKNFIFIIGVLYTFYGFFEGFINFFFYLIIGILNRGKNLDILDKYEYKLVGVTNIMAAVLLLICAIIKKIFLTFDPLDSDFICYELSINLTSFYGLEKISKVISKNYFINFIENKIE